MALYSPRASGINNSAAYQVAGKPYMHTAAAPNGSTTTIEFPNVTKQIVFVNNGATGENIKIAFSTQGLTGTQHFIVPPVIDAGLPITLDTKVTKIYITAAGAWTPSYSLYAGLTGVPSADLPNSWLGTSGVGGP
jgi:hypothetical protein